MYHAALFYRGARMTSLQLVAPSFTRVVVERPLRFDELRILGPDGKTAFAISTWPMSYREVRDGDWVEVTPQTPIDPRG